MNEHEIRFSWLVPAGPKSLPDQLEQCIASIIPQMQPNDELILVRDAAEQQWKCDYHWVDKFGPMIKGDPQGMPWPCRANLLPNVVTVDAGSPRDCGQALNCGLIRVKNPFVIRQDADDWDVGYKGKSRREMHVGQIMNGPGMDAWGFGMRTCQWIGNETPWQLKSPCIPMMLKHEGELRDKAWAAMKAGECPVYHPATCFRTESLVKVGGWAEGFHGFEDWGLYLRMLMAGMTLWADQEPVIVHRRRHQDNARQRAEIDSVNAMKAESLKLAEQGKEPDPSGWRMKPFSWNKSTYDPYHVQSIEVPIISHDVVTGEKIEPDTVTVKMTCGEAAKFNKSKFKSRKKPVSAPSSVDVPSGKTPGSDDSIPETTDSGPPSYPGSSS